MKQKLLCFIFPEPIVTDLHRRMQQQEFIKIWMVFQKAYNDIDFQTGNYWNREGAWLLAIDDELVEYQISALNTVMRNTGLYLMREDVRAMIKNPAVIDEFNKSEFAKYGHFDFIKTESPVIQIPAITKKQ